MNLSVNAAIIAPERQGIPCTSEESLGWKLCAKCAFVRVLPSMLVLFAVDKRLALREKVNHGKRRKTNDRGLGVRRLQPYHVEGDYGLDEALELELFDRIQFHHVLDVYGDPLGDQDLPGMGLIAEA